jgi:hypothetical protein
MTDSRTCVLLVVKLSLVFFHLAFRFIIIASASTSTATVVGKAGKSLLSRLITLSDDVDKLA